MDLMLILMQTYGDRKPTCDACHEWFCVEVIILYQVEQIVVCVLSHPNPPFLCHHNQHTSVISYLWSYMSKTMFKFLFLWFFGRSFSVQKVLKLQAFTFSYFLQTQGMRPGVVPYRSTLSALRRIAHEEGIRGLYRFVAPIIINIPY